jgi:hypothetical protein
LTFVLVVGYDTVPALIALIKKYNPVNNPARPSNPNKANKHGEQPFLLSTYPLL